MVGKGAWPGPSHGAGQRTLSEIEITRASSRFNPLLQVLESAMAESLDDGLLVIRTLLIDYRVIAIRDPHLPSSLLPHPGLDMPRLPFAGLVPAGSCGSEACVPRDRKPPMARRPSNQALWSRFVWRLQATGI